MSNGRQESQGRDGGDGALMPPPAARQPAPPAASARAQAQPAEDGLFVRHLQQTIKSLEAQLEHAKTAGSNKQVDLGRQAEDLTQVRLERDVLRQQLATLRESSNGHHAQVARMQGELDKKNAEVADSARILGDMAQTHVAILSWESIMDKDSLAIPVTLLLAESSDLGLGRDAVEQPLWHAWPGAPGLSPASQVWGLHRIQKRAPHRALGP